MALFEHENYKVAVAEILQGMPKKGYGQYRRIAQHLNINSVIVTQIFKGDRDLTPEQALDLAAYFGFSELETRYFFVQVQLARAGNHRLKQYLKAELAELRLRSKDLKQRVLSEGALTEEAKAIFYSHWYMSAVRLLSSVSGYQSVDSIAEKLGLSRSTAKQAAEFLLLHGLIVEDGNRLKMGPRTTHLESASPFVARHHANWRMRGLRNMESVGNDELFYTGPMALSEEAAAWVRSQLVELVQKVVAHVSASESERLACLNIDWFDFTRR